MSAADRTIEELKVASHQLKETVEKLVHEGNVRRIIVKNGEGRVLLDMPLAAGIAGVILLPFFTAIAALMMLAKEFTVVIEREPAKGVSTQPPKENA